MDSQRVQMKGGSVVFDEGSGTDAFDGLDVDDAGASLTSVRLQVDGALRFAVGENARAHAGWPGLLLFSLRSRWWQEGRI